MFKQLFNYGNRNIIRSALICKRFTSSEQAIQLTNENIANVCITDALSLEPEQRVAVKGWVQRISKQKHLTFVHLNDGQSTKSLQIVIDNDNETLINSLPQFGSSLFCAGVIKQSEGNKQKVELHCDHLSVIGNCDAENFPISYKNMDWKNLRPLPHLRPKVAKYAALMRIRSEVTQSVHQLMKENGYTFITTPIITSSDCEGAGLVFSVKSPFCTAEDSYFNTDAHLTVSGQFHLEAAACGLTKVYTISPAFRAENSQTNRHASEFTMIEVEECFLNSLDHLMDNVEFFIKSMANTVFEARNDEMTRILKDREHYKIFKKIVDMKYIRLTYHEAIDLVNKKQTIEPIKYGDDLSSFHEKVLLDYFEQTPLFITHYPIALKPFYMKRDLNDKALCFDLICPIGGEICGGSLREDDYEQLEQRILQMKNPDTLKWYLDLREFGNVPHGGFGIGFDRFIQSITGIISLKDVITFPRWSHHCKL